MIDKTINVGKIMTTNVITLHPEDTMDKVKVIFDTNSIHHIPIVEDNKVVGIISKTDYLKLLHSFTLFKTTKSDSYNAAIMRSLLVSEVMTKQVAKLNLTDSVETAVGFFRENLFHALPVVTTEGNLVGIITTYDLLNFAFSEPMLLG